MRSLHTLRSTSSFATPTLYVPQPARCTRFFHQGDCHGSYSHDLRRRATVLQVTLDKELSNPENATAIDGNNLLTVSTTMTQDVELMDVEDLSFVETTTSTTSLEPKTTESTNDQLKVVPRDESENTKPFFLGMSSNAIFALNAVAVIWGTQHAVIKLVVDDAEGGAGPFTLLRFAIGAVIASIPLLKTHVDVEEMAPADAGDDRVNLIEDIGSGVSRPKLSTEDGNLNTVWRWGTEMGFWMFLGFAFQAIGLETTTAQRSGFLLYLNVKFVPFFAFLILGRKISIPTLVSAFTAFGGTALLAYDGTSWSLNQGDLWSIGAAGASAMYILRLDKASKEVGDNNSIQLNAACLWVVTILSGIWSVGTTHDASLLFHELVHIVSSHPLEIIYLSAVTTALANYIQTKSQKEISAERASVIYAMDPVYGAVFSNLLLGETLTSIGFLGAGLITVAAATNALLDLGPTEENANDTRKSQ